VVSNRWARGLGGKMAVASGIQRTDRIPVRGLQEDIFLYGNLMDLSLIYEDISVTAILSGLYQ
jgi:hypothetical protein